MNMIPWYYKAGAVALIVLALVGAEQWREHTAYQRGYDTAVKETTRASLESQVTASYLAAEETQALQAKIDAASVQRLKDTTDHEKALSDLRARARDGSVGLSMPAGSSCRQGSTDNPGATGGPRTEARTDLMPGTVDAILGIAGRAANDVRDYNALIDQYNAARELCNKASP